MQTDATAIDEEAVSREVALSLSKINGMQPQRNPSQTREGYGFRPRSGLATPQIVQDEESRETSSPIPDQYGLGWPGECFECLRHKAPTESFSTTEQQSLRYLA